MKSERLAKLVLSIDAGNIPPMPAWFLTAGGFIHGNIVSRAAFNHAFFTGINIAYEDRVTTVYEEAVANGGFELKEFSDPPEVYLSTVTINHGHFCENVACLWLNQEDIITWGLGEPTNN